MALNQLPTDLTSFHWHFGATILSTATCPNVRISPFSSASPLMSKSSVVAAWPEQALYQRFTSVNAQEHAQTCFLTGNKKSAEKLEQQKLSRMHQSCPSGTWALCGPTVMGIPYNNHLEEKHITAGSHSPLLLEQRDVLAEWFHLNSKLIPLNLENMDFCW